MTLKDIQHHVEEKVIFFTTLYKCDKSNNIIPLRRGLIFLI